MIGCRPGEEFTITVDGTDCEVEEKGGKGRKKGKKDPKLYSQKFNGAGVRYEVAVAIFSDHIVSVKGPFPCGRYPDLKIYKEFGLSERLLAAGERAVADGTYRHFTVSERGKGRSSWRAYKNRFRARQETVNNRIKIFNCFQQRWRHSHKHHGDTFRAAVFFTQLSFQYNPLMSSLVYTHYKGKKHLK